MISSLHEACKVLDTQECGIPYEAIEYLRNQPNSKHLENKIIYALEHAYDGTYHNHEEEIWLDSPLWYAIVAEKHLSKKLIEPTIHLFTTIDEDWDLLNEQSQYLLGKLAEQYPEEVMELVTQAIDACLLLNLKTPYLYLFDVFYFVDKKKYTPWFLQTLHHKNLYWKESFIADLADLQIKEALPIIKKLYANKRDLHQPDIKESIRILETGISDYPEYNISYSQQRDKQGDWKAHYKPFENHFSEEEKQEDSDEDFSLPLPVEKIGRNDLCWCGSGKKYKKCHYLQLN